MIVRIGSDKSMRLCYVDRTKRARKITGQRGVEVESVEEWMVFWGRNLLPREEIYGGSSA
jgi:hypothetical protein